MLKIKNLTVASGDKVILKDFNLTIKENEIHTIMGKNGAGKSTICKVIMGDNSYKVLNGSITYNDINLLELDTTKRARNGIFLLNQMPIEIEGVTNSEMLRTALGEKNNTHVDLYEFNKKIEEVCQILHLDKSFIHRGINESMSGGERKKNELLHMWMLEPSLIILDELDSGLDVDSLKILGNSLKEYLNKYSCSLLIITHHTTILKYLKPDYVHVLDNGSITLTGDSDLANNIEEQGFDTILGQIK